MKHIVTVGYTNLDDGIHVECSCGLDEKMGFAPDIDDIVAIKQNHISVRPAQQEQPVTIEMNETNMSILEEAFEWAFSISEEGRNGEGSAAGLAYKTLKQLSNPLREAAAEQGLFVKQADPELERLLEEEDELQRIRAAGLDPVVCERVKLGAQFLDDNDLVNDDWRDDIDTEHFNIGSTRMCVLGQIYLPRGDYFDTKNKLNLHDVRAQELGFARWDADSSAGSLQNAWLHYLTDGGF